MPVLKAGMELHVAKHVYTVCRVYRETKMNSYQHKFHTAMSFHLQRTPKMQTEISNLIQVPSSLVFVASSEFDFHDFVGSPHIN